MRPVRSRIATRAARESASDERRGCGGAWSAIVAATVRRRLRVSSDSATVERGDSRSGIVLPMLLLLLLLLLLRLRLRERRLKLPWSCCNRDCDGRRCSCRSRPGACDERLPPTPPPFRNFGLRSSFANALEISDSLDAATPAQAGNRFLGEKSAAALFLAKGVPGRGATIASSGATTTTAARWCRSRDSAMSCRPRAAAAWSGVVPRMSTASARHPPSLVRSATNASTLSAPSASSRRRSASVPSASTSERSGADQRVEASTVMHRAAPIARTAARSASAARTASTLPASTARPSAESSPARAFRVSAAFLLVGAVSAHAMKARSAAASASRRCAVRDAARFSSARRRARKAPPPKAKGVEVRAAPAATGGPRRGLNIPTRICK